MAESVPERSILIRSRLETGYTLSESATKGLQHVFTDWFPRALYTDLTDDTVSVDVLVRRDFLSGKSVFSVTFKRQDGSTVKNKEYSQDRMTGTVCDYYDKKSARYDGNRDGFDHRIVVYADPMSGITQKLPRIPK